MNSTDATAMIGCISLAFFVQIFVMQYMMNPAAIPLVMPYVKLMMATVKNAGTASLRSFQLISANGSTIRIPTTMR